MASAHNLSHTILVIDDDDVMRELLSLVLDAPGRTLLTAASGDEALNLLATLKAATLPAVILTDLQMPGLSGATLAASLRQACPSARLLAMSGSRPTASAAAPFDAFLLKPFTAEDFTAALTTDPVPTAAPASSPEPQALDEAVYAKLTTTMPPAQLRQLYTLCLDDALTRITRMTTASAAGDAATFTREAHAIKGGCGMLGASQLHALASRMETGALISTPLLHDFTLAADRLRRILDARS